MVSHRLDDNNIYQEESVNKQTTRSSDGGTGERSQVVSALINERSSRKTSRQFHVKNYIQVSTEESNKALGSGSIPLREERTTSSPRNVGHFNSSLKAAFLARRLGGCCCHCLVVAWLAWCRYYTLYSPSSAELFCPPNRHHNTTQNSPRGEEETQNEFKCSILFHFLALTLAGLSPPSHASSFVQLLLKLLLNIWILDKREITT